jgi:glycogen debranching enzyme
LNLLSGCFLLPLQAQSADKKLELGGEVNPSRFMSVTGQQAALFGKESGQFEAWAYPLKILRDFHLNFHVYGQVLPGASLVRSVIVRPESTTIVYAGDTFAVRETLCVPIHEPAAIIRLDIDTSSPLDIEAAFTRDFQLEWPAPMGGSYMDWNPLLHGFAMKEATGRFEAVVGSPSATESEEEYDTNYSSSSQNAFLLGITPKGHATKVIVIAASTDGHDQSEKLYRQLTLNYMQPMDEAAAYYRDQLKNTVKLTLPDAALQQAYEWSQVSMLQSVVQNPFLGTGLIAGYRTSGDDQRPGFAWFFGRDALWTSLALDDIQDFGTARTALEFLAKYQRDDGKIAHEISQGASLVPWFTKMPYAYAAADATPLYIIASNQYVVQSGDLDYAQKNWDHIWKAYQFLLSTYDGDGLPQNAKFGHGWVEGGPLFPEKTEIYQDGVSVEAIRALSSLSHLLGKDDLSRQLNQLFEEKKELLNQTFWVPQTGHYAFAISEKSNLIDIPSVLATVPMWFGLLDEQKAEQTITQLSGPDQRTDWGMRILSSTNPEYDPGGYHWGSVWPLFSGWAAVAEYRYHRPLEAYANLRTNALLTFDGARGHIAEVYSGDYYQPLATGSPHQIWSAAMVAAPVLQGMLGLHVNAFTHTLSFSPDVPADWTSFKVENVKVGSCSLNLQYQKTEKSIQLEIAHSGARDCELDFAPALSPRAKVRQVLLNGRNLPFQMEQHGDEQQLHVHFQAGDPTQTLTLRMEDEFGLAVPVSLPMPGAASSGLRILSQTWTADHDALSITAEGASGASYDLGVWNPGEIASVEGADLVPVDTDNAKLKLGFPDDPAGYTKTTVVILFRHSTKGR